MLRAATCSTMWHRMRLDTARRLEDAILDSYEGALTTEYVASSWRGQDDIEDPRKENEQMRQQLVDLIDEIWMGPAV